MGNKKQYIGSKKKKKDDDNDGNNNDNNSKTGNNNKKKSGGRITVAISGGNGWYEYIDEKTGKPYYSNGTETTWTKPKGFQKMPHQNPPPLPPPPPSPLLTQTHTNKQTH